MIEVRQVSYSYKREGVEVPVLSNLDLTIERGDFVAIQGPSGSGKSTLLYLLGCLLDIQSGEILIDGENVSAFDGTSLALFRNRKIGFVFQQFHLLARSTVLQNILLPTIYPCEFEKPETDFDTRAEKLATRLGLGDRLEHMPNQLSGGQQQRVAIARALMNDPEIILADEPTGNLDSHSSGQIMDLLAELNAEGRTVVVITHDSEVAERCKKIIKFRDGQVSEVIENENYKPVLALSRNADQTGATQTLSQLGPGPVQQATALAKSTAASPKKHHTRGDAKMLSREGFTQYWHLAQLMLPIAKENLVRNKVRTLLTMLGIIIGIASVLAMITLGDFTKRRVLESYVILGANTVIFYGNPNWEQKATDRVAVSFRSFDIKRDIEPLFRIFDEVQKLAPNMSDWDVSNVSFAGRVVDKDVQMIGTTPEGVEISGREIFAGRNFSPFHVEEKSSVCLIGYEIGEKLFKAVSPVGQILQVQQSESSFGCQIIGVLKSMSNSSGWAKPNLQIILPYTFYQTISRNWWSSQIRQLLIQLRPNIEISHYAEGIRAFFAAKYGSSGDFRVDSNSVLLAQMDRFLSLFTLLLALIAFMSLLIGGVGIANMMLVSVSERFREIGLRKALGATDFSIRVQFLMESLVICLVAGAIGITLGFVVYEGVILGATKFVNKLKFEFMINWGALFLSLFSIVIVGVLSGLFPAIKAERLQVIDALRSD